MSRVVQVDPEGCGCTECLVGEYVPLDRATDLQLYLLATGKLSNATGHDVVLVARIGDHEVELPDIFKEAS